MKITQKKLRVYLLITLFISLVGCSKSAHDAKNSDLKDSIVQDEKILASEIIKASLSKDPWEAFLVISAVKEKICAKNEECNSLPSWNKLFDAEIAYMTKSIEKGEAKAFEIMYLENAYKNLRVQPENIEKLLAYVDQNHGALKEDRGLLLVAATYVSDGDYVLRDIDRAQGYLARAWALGNQEAANMAALLYLSIKDYSNAYLWSLRCITYCHRNRQVDLDELQKLLSLEVIKQAQIAALDNSIIELNIGAD